MKKKVVLASFRQEDDMYKIILSILDKINSVMKKPKMIKDKEEIYYLNFYNLFAGASNRKMTPIFLSCCMDEEKILNKKQLKSFNEFKEDNDYLVDKLYEINAIDLYEYVKENKKEINSIEFISNVGIRIGIKSRTMNDYVSSITLKQSKKTSETIEELESKINFIQKNFTCYENLLSVYIENDIDFLNSFINAKGIVSLIAKKDSSEIFISKDDDVDLNEYYKIIFTNKILTGQQGLITPSMTETKNGFQLDIFKVEEVDCMYKADLSFYLNDNKSGEIKRCVTNEILFLM